MWWTCLITFRVSRRRHEMYCGHARLCVCGSICLSICLSAAACLRCCMHPNVTWGSGRGCPLVVHYWADLQSVHQLCCYGNIKRTQNVRKYMLVLALCLAVSVGGKNLSVVTVLLCNILLHSSVKICLVILYQITYPWLWVYICHLCKNCLCVDFPAVSQNRSLRYLETGVTVQDICCQSWKKGIVQ